MATEPETPSPDVMEVAESIVSSANVTTCDGYYEVDIDAAATVIAEAKARWLAEKDAEIARLRGAMEEIRNLPGEINPSNYDHDDACELNRQFCNAVTIADAALKEPRP